MTDRHYVERFHCDPQLPCYCGSEKPFGECCGSTSEEREPPQGVHIVPNFLPSTDCRRLVRFAEKQKANWLMVRDSKKSTPGKYVEKRDSNRITQQVEMGKHQAFLNDCIRRALVEVAGRRYGAAESFETPYILRYKVGGKYAKHSDSEQYDADKQLFYRAADRDISLLIYLNDDYEGGDLTFNRLNYTYKPTAGDLVIFPSGNLYLHQARTITRGTKYALVSWSSLKSSRNLFANASRLPPIKV